MTTKIDAVRNRIYWALHEKTHVQPRLSDSQLLAFADIAARAAVETDEILAQISVTLPYNLARQVGMESNEDRRRERAVEDSIRDAELVLRKVAELPPTK